MTQFRLIDRRRGTRQVRDAFAEAIGSVKRDVYRGVARVVVEASPVDSGTYMDGHAITSSRGDLGDPTSSHGRERDQPREPYVESAISRLDAQIDNLPDDADGVRIGNTAVHAPLVEYGGARMTRVYAPYATGQQAAPGIIRDAVRRNKV